MDNYAVAKKNKNKENVYELIGSSLGHTANQKEAKFKCVYNMLSFSKERYIYKNIHFCSFVQKKCKKDKPETNEIISCKYWVGMDINGEEDWGSWEEVGSDTSPNTFLDNLDS